MAPVCSYHVQSFLIKVRISDDEVTYSANSKHIEFKALFSSLTQKSLKRFDKSSAFPLRLVTHCLLMLCSFEFSNSIILGITFTGYPDVLHLLFTRSIPGNSSILSSFLQWNKDHFLSGNQATPCKSAPAEGLPYYFSMLLIHTLKSHYNLMQLHEWGTCV